MDDARNPGSGPRRSEATSKKPRERPGNIRRGEAERSEQAVSRTGFGGCAPKNIVVHMCTCAGRRPSNWCTPQSIPESADRSAWTRAAANYPRCFFIGSNAEAASTCRQRRARIRAASRAKRARPRTAPASQAAPPVHLRSPQGEQLVHSPSESQRRQECVHRAQPPVVPSGSSGSPDQAAST